MIAFHCTLIGNVAPVRVSSILLFSRRPRIWYLCTCSCAGGTIWLVKPLSSGKNCFSLSYYYILESQLKYIVRIATSEDHRYAVQITNEMTCSAVKRGVDITQRTPGFIKEKMNKGLAVIALNPDNKEWAAFAYLEVWRHRKYVANSGLIVSPKYRGIGVSTDLKAKLFEYSRNKFPQAKLFSITASPAVIHVNAALGYIEVSQAELLRDKLFMKGCKSWVNFTGLMRIEKTKSHYVAMVYTPPTEAKRLTAYRMRQYFKKRNLIKRRSAGCDSFALLETGL